MLVPMVMSIARSMVLLMRVVVVVRLGHAPILCRSTWRSCAWRGLVTSRRKGRHVVYAARSGHVRRFATEVLFAVDHHLTGTPDHD